MFSKSKGDTTKSSSDNSAYIRGESGISSFLYFERKLFGLFRASERNKDAKASRIVGRRQTRRHICFISLPQPVVPHSRSVFGGKRPIPFRLREIKSFSGRLASRLLAECETPASSSPRNKLIRLSSVRGKSTKVEKNENKVSGKRSGKNLVLALRNLSSTRHPPLPPTLSAY